MDNKSQRIYILTDTTLYYYDLQGESLVEVGAHEIDEALGIYRVLEEGGLCVSHTLIDHTTAKTLEIDGTKCSVMPGETLKERYEDIELPEGYEIKKV